MESVLIVLLVLNYLGVTRHETSPNVSQIQPQILLPNCVVDAQKEPGNQPDARRNPPLKNDLLSPDNGVQKCGTD